jgi:hypothetical protein
MLCFFVFFCSFFAHLEGSMLCFLFLCIQAADLRERNKKRKEGKVG